MIEGYGYPVIYFIPANEKDDFILSKRIQGYKLKEMQYIAERCMYMIEMTFEGMDLVD